MRAIDADDCRVLCAVCGGALSSELCEVSVSVSAPPPALACHCMKLEGKKLTSE